MPKAQQDRAWDADALLGWLGEEPDKQPLCETVIRAAEHGGVRIVLSTLATVEVLKLRHKTPVPKSAQKRIEDFFSQPYVVRRNLDPATAELARGLFWDHGIAPKDAAHVATALRAGVEILDTFDGGLIRKSPLEVEGYKTLVIGKPYIKNTQLKMMGEESEGGPDA